MKKDIHPEYVTCEVICGCGEHFVTRSTRPEIRIEICSKCHPFYTGKQKFVDSAGRVEKFQRRWGTHVEEQKARILGGKQEPAAEAPAEPQEAPPADAEPSEHTPGEQ